MKEDPESKSLGNYLVEVANYVQDFRQYMLENLDIKIRFYSCYAISLSPLYFARKHKIGKMCKLMFLSWYFIFPEQLKAILRTK
mmetsp:Transcript_30873/g.35269  ORF Transcript_30873/g.35269 Transcript_30873/m.35269 type:complete len:84 (+) Transcript_30873:318-569(+)